MAPLHVALVVGLVHALPVPCICVQAVPPVPGLLLLLLLFLLPPLLVFLPTVLSATWFQAWAERLQHRRTLRRSALCGRAAPLCRRDTPLGRRGAPWLLGWLRVPLLLGGRGAVSLLRGRGTPWFLGGRGTLRLLGGLGTPWLFGRRGATRLLGRRGAPCLFGRRGAPCLQRVLAQRVPRRRHWTRKRGWSPIYRMDRMQGLQISTIPRRARWEGWSLRPAT
mmetsp:Transcript_121307/g.294307  ORF Transcript_121307/g.294307 Transcript_121307/m.294307 type:complete len:222 (-) Transcript_121307:30-695(-)